VEFSIPLNKFEKEQKVIELHKQGKTIRQIAPEVRMSFRDTLGVFYFIFSYYREMVSPRKLRARREWNRPCSRVLLQSI
jgi:hypothetical protein